MVMDSEEQTGRYLAEFGLRAGRFGKTEVGRGRTPDFRVFDAGGRLAFYCEVKTIQGGSQFERDVNEALSKGAVYGPTGGSGRDTGQSRIADRIREAVKQFNAVNPQREYPNVLAIVNTNDEIDFTYLRAAVTGCEYSASGPVPMFQGISEGRICQDKLRIDLYLWFDRADAQPFGLFTGSNAGHLEALCSYLRIDPKQIRRLPSP